MKLTIFPGHWKIYHERVLQGYRFRYSESEISGNNTKGSKLEQQSKSLLDLLQPYTKNSFQLTLTRSTDELKFWNKSFFILDKIWFCKISTKTDHQSCACSMHLLLNLVCIVLYNVLSNSSSKYVVKIIVKTSLSTTKKDSLKVKVFWGTLKHYFRINKLKSITVVLMAFYYHVKVINA